MELILVRHGQPAWITADGVNTNNPGLTARGRAQAEAAARRLADPADLPCPGPVDRVVASPTVRAAETAAPIGTALSRAVETEPWLLEIHNPAHWEGSPLEDIEAAFAEVRGRTRDDMWTGVTGGEHVGAFHQRIAQGLRGFLASVGVAPAETRGLWTLGPAAPDRIIAVAHGGTNSTIIAHLLGVEPEPWEWDRFAMGHGSIAVLRTVRMAGAHLWSLQSLGDATHIPVPDRTA